MGKVFKDKKFLIILGAVFVACILLINVVVGGAPKRHNNSLKKNIQKTVEVVAQECGLENLEVVYVDDGSYVKIVMECDKMADISYEQKEKFFKDTLKAMQAKGEKYSFYANDKVAVYSNGTRYTAFGSESIKIYENGKEIDPETNRIKVNSSQGSVESSGSSSSSSSNKTNSSSSSSSSSSKGCKGGVSCRAGYKPCNPHSKTGYCRSCCKI